MGLFNNNQETNCRQCRRVIENYARAKTVNGPVLLRVHKVIDNKDANLKAVGLNPNDARLAANDFSKLASIESVRSGDVGDAESRDLKRHFDNLKDEAIKLSKKAA